VVAQVALSPHSFVPSLHAHILRCRSPPLPNPAVSPSQDVRFRYAWFLSHAQVDVLLINTGQQCSFYYNGWLSRDDPPYKTEVELFPSDGDPQKLCRCSSASVIRNGP
jgi:hypothetical protein